jgi:hypothetical protein
MKIQLASRHGTPESNQKELKAASEVVTAGRTTTSGVKFSASPDQQ